VKSGRFWILFVFYTSPMRPVTIFVCVLICSFILLFDLETTALTGATL